MSHSSAGPFCWTYHSSNVASCKTCSFSISWSASNQYGDARALRIYCRATGNDELRGRVHDLCKRLLTASGVPATALAYETLAWLDEVTSSEEASATTKADGANGDSAHPPRLDTGDAAQCAARMAHWFPTCGTAWAVLGLTLARRVSGRKTGPPGKQAGVGPAKAGAALAALLLEHGCMQGGGGTAAAWIALTQLRLRAGDWDAALAAVAGGMAWVRPA